MQILNKYTNKNIKSRNLKLGSVNDRIFYRALIDEEEDLIDDEKVKSTAWIDRPKALSPENLQESHSMIKEKVPKLETMSISSSASISKGI